MKDKVIILDVDGTLLPSNNDLDNDSISYLHSLEENNTVVLCSGRGYHDLFCVHEKLGLKGPIISNNGGSLDFFDGTPSVTMSISEKSLKTIFKNHKQIIKSAYYSYKNNIYIYNRLDKLNFLYKITNNTNVIEGDFDKLELQNPNSVYFIIDNDKKENFFNDINENYKNEISLFEYGHDLKNSIVILSLKNTNKAYAILELLMIVNKTELDTIIFGDAEVDISMLKLHGITVAMKNGCSEAKNVAMYITDYDNNNQGVVKFLQKLDTK